MKLFKYLFGFFKSLFIQLFKKDGIKKVESENAGKILRKPISHAEYKEIRKRLFRTYRKPCELCGEAMVVHRGQVVRFHKKCRKNRSLRRKK